MRRFGLARPRAAAGGGGGGSPGDLLETVTLDNYSGATRANPQITFRRFFEEGDVPAGSHVELYNAGGSAIAVQQGDGTVAHGDGSLRAATFSFVGESSVADGASTSVELRLASGGFSSGTSISRTTLTTADWRMRVRIGGTDYYCLLNNLDTAGTWREKRAGAAVRSWHHWGVFRNGTGASDTDHGQLQGHFYSNVWEDGRIEVFGLVANGRAAACAEYTVQQMELLEGASSRVLHTTSFTFSGWNLAFLCRSDALPYTATLHHFHARADADYLYEKKILQGRIYSTNTQRAAISIPSALTYAPNAPAGAIGSAGIDDGGGSSWIGILPTWTANAMLLSADASISAANRKTMLQNDRVNALAQGVKVSANVISHTSGHPPVLVNQDYTASGLTAAQPTMGWGAGATLTRSGGTYAGASQNATHGPAYAAFLAATTGGEHWMDLEFIRVVAYIGNANPGNTQWYHRRALLNDAANDSGWFFYQMQRSWSWLGRDASNCAWNLPDTHPCKAYADQIITNGNAIVQAFLTSPYKTNGDTFWSDSGRAALGVIPTIYAPEGYGWAPWMGSYEGIAYGGMLRRAQVASSHKLIADHLVKQIIGFFAACPYHALTCYYAGLRDQSGPGNITTLFTDVLGGTDGTWNHCYIALVNNNQATDFARKLVSDSGGTSGSCPVSGMGGPEPNYGAGHSYANIAQCMFEVLSDTALASDVSALLTYVRAEETAAALSEATWAAAGTQWRLRA